MTPETTIILNGYFKSIERSFEETVLSQQATDRAEKMAISVAILFLLSIVPVFPLFFKYLMPWVFKTDAISIRGHQIPLASLGFWWVTLGVISFISMFLFLRWTNRRRKRKRANWLSEPQMRFASCYSIADNIKKYQTNGLTKHIDNATLDWERLMKMLVSLLRPYNFILPTGMKATSVQVTEEPMWKRSGRMCLYSELDMLKERFSWFRIDPLTSAIIEAFDTLPLKTRDRLQDKKDLNEVASCLQDLSGYLYSKIPNVPRPHGAESLTGLGDVCLQHFAGQLKILEPYATEVKPEVKPSQFWKTIGAIPKSVISLFSHRSIIACFVTWYVFVQVLIILALRTTLHFFPSVTIDSVVVTTVVGCPLVCAVTAVAVSRERRQETSTDKNDKSSPGDGT